MIKVHFDGANIEEFYVYGTPEMLNAEIAELIGIVYRKICNVDKREGETFKNAMVWMLTDESPVWDSPDLPGNTTVLTIPRK
jgi:hypothetical protein